MATQTNADRAGWAQTALDAFKVATRCDEEDEVAFGDLLCDLMHWARRRGIDFDQHVDSAREMHAIEVAEDEEG